MGDVVNRGTKDRPLWYIRYKDIDGRRRQRASHQTTKQAALAYLREVEARVARGIIGVPERAQQVAESVTIGELAARFLAEAKPRAKDPGTYRMQIRSVLKQRVLPLIGTRRADGLKLADVEALRDRLQEDGYSANSAAHAICALSVVYKWARKAGLIHCECPSRGIVMPKPARSLDYLDRDEAARLLAYAEVHAPDAFPAIATAIYAGLRKGEIFGLRWCDIHLDTSRLDVMRSYRLPPKSGRARHLPLHPALARILRDWRKRCPTTAEGLVFPVNGRMGDTGDMLNLARLLGESGCHIPAKPWHALRHTFASHFVMAGGSLYVLQRLLGHASAEMTQIYAHLSPDHLAGELGRLDFSRPLPAGIASLDEARTRRAAAAVDR
jgi:integrase